MQKGLLYTCGIRNGNDTDNKENTLVLDTRLLFKDCLLNA